MNAIAMATLSVLVKKRTTVADRVVSLELVGADGSELPDFTAGAHVDVFLQPGLVRQYSLWNAPSDRNRYCIAVQREPDSRGGSEEIHDRVAEGMRLTIGAPRNVFSLAVASRTVLIAGGIGVTPLLSMAEHLASTNQDFAFHYCASTSERAAFHDLILASPFAGRVRFYFSNTGDRMDVAGILSEPAAGTHVYVCGPKRLIEAARSAAKGWPSENVHYEHFDAAPTNEYDRGFDVVLKRSDRRVHVNADESVADALARAGVPINVSCQQGVCGTCVTTVLEGEPDHRDIFLTESEHVLNDQFTPCCSRSKSDCLVLDL